MTRRSIVFGVFMILAFSAMQLTAHDAYRIIGTISKWQSPRLEVRTKEGGRVSILVISEVDIFLNNKKVSQKELKVGRSVVVDALGDSIAELEAVKVNIR